MTGKQSILERHTPDPTVFDAVAGTYDIDFTETTLGRILRRRVWNRLQSYFKPGQKILELACGTGEDAMWLAGWGVQITATDGSDEMIHIVQEKARHFDFTSLVNVQKLSLQEIAHGQTPFTDQTFEGVLSNFGGINTIDDWHSLAQGLARLLRPGSFVVLVPMGPFCPWEIFWYLAHRQIMVAFRRFSQPVLAKVGEREIPIWYPSASRLRREFSPWFELLSSESLGLWLPPSYLSHMLSHWSRLWVGLSGLEAATARLSAGWGDHYILILERNERSSTMMPVRGDHGAG